METVLRVYQVYSIVCGSRIKCACRSTLQNKNLQNQYMYIHNKKVEKRPVSKNDSLFLKHTLRAVVCASQIINHLFLDNQKLIYKKTRKKLLFYRNRHKHTTIQQRWWESVEYQPTNIFQHFYKFFASQVFFFFSYIRRDIYKI